MCSFNSSGSDSCSCSSECGTELSDSEKVTVLLDGLAPIDFSKKITP